jgi:general secretion pathway protein A
MILRHFNLREQPFGVTPDPRYLFDTSTHREALAALLYGIESGLGFIALTANPGMGKTTILFEALARLGESARTVFLFQAIQNPTDLVRALLIDLGEKDPQGTLVDLETRLNEILVRQSETGKRLVVVLDEAQNLDHSVLEAVRMLSNFETGSHKLLQIVLCGQLQLADRLWEPGMLQLRQRISIFAYLKPLTLVETANYIQHRLKVAGHQGSKPLFTTEAVALIARHSGGIPRNINNLCFNALSLGCALKKSVINADAVKEVIGDLNVQRTAIGEHITITEAEPVRRRPSIGARMRRAWPSLRVASIMAVLFAIALAGGRLIRANSAALSAGSGARSTPSVAVPSPLRTDASVVAPVPTAVQHQAPAQVDSSVQASAPVQAQAEDTASVSPPPQSENRKHAVLAGSSAQNTPAKRNVRLVAARRGQSLIAICNENFGTCQPSLLNRIIRLNPRISNPDYIQKGQRVILPDEISRPAGNDHARAGG